MPKAPSRYQTNYSKISSDPVVRDVAKVRPESSADGVLGNPERAKTRDSQANGRTSVGRNPTNTPSQQIATCETVELAVGDKPITRVADLRS